MKDPDFHGVFPYLVSPVDSEGHIKDGVLAIMEAYFPVPVSGVVDYFKAIARSVSCPIVLYTNPNFQRSDLTIEAL
jgi:dihydrodipicolinate synthase/N-acetylneuraminate lyase